MPTPAILITGATSGFGEANAYSTRKGSVCL